LLRAVARGLPTEHPPVEAQVRTARRSPSSPAGASRSNLFFERLDNVFGHAARVSCSSGLSDTPLRRRELDDPTVSSYLNTIEHEYELIAYVADSELTNWTRKAIRQAASSSSSSPGRQHLNQSKPLRGNPPPARRRPCSCMIVASGYRGTAAWLRDRDVFMHHQVALEDDLDFKSLHRF
jgi:hypothetical protein